MDRLKSMGGDAMGLKNVNFTASKDEVCSQLEQKGVPSQVVDKVRNANTSQFDCADNVMAKVR